ncbi:hypothetical protein PHISCL_03467 [Aspergillus sclerotialis]|uniref:Uncharacterized protein n=1 Tax=Aspergillus sclerotialis TaxID=2070753 RepID=A0A3A2ZNK7_9EURO|nr:hypothetical protein PHISCL_03467 [Aspergillus sclerotialis]
MTCDQSPQANDPFLTPEPDVWPEFSSNELFNLPTGYYDFDPYFPEPWTEACDFALFNPLESVDPNLLCLDRRLSLPTSEAKGNLSQGILNEPTMISGNSSRPSSMSPGVSGASTGNNSNDSSLSSMSPGVSGASSSSTAKTTVSPDSRSGTNTTSSSGEVSNESHGNLQESQSVLYVEAIIGAYIDVKNETGISFTSLDELYPSAPGVPSIYARLKNGYLVYIPSGTTCFVSSDPRPNANDAQRDGLPLSPRLSDVNDSVFASDRFDPSAVRHYALGDCDADILAKNITNDAADGPTPICLPLRVAKKRREYHFVKPETLETISRYY